MLQDKSKVVWGWGGEGGGAAGQVKGSEGVRGEWRVQSGGCD